MFDYQSIVSRRRVYSRRLWARAPTARVTNRRTRKGSAHEKPNLYNLPRFRLGVSLFARRRGGRPFSGLLLLNASEYFRELPEKIAEDVHEGDG